jgi:hypothetical protein
VYAVLGEAPSDAETVKVLIRRLAGNDRLTVKTKGYQGCGELKRKGAKQIALFAKLNCFKFVVCYDADGPDPTERRAEIEDRVTRPSGLPASGCCIVIPVQELEAWILADISAVTKVFTGWHPEPIKNPEGIASPKERLERLSRAGGSRPRYSHAVHNPAVAAHLDLQRVRKSCPSFLPLVQFVTGKA